MRRALVPLLIAVVVAGGIVLYGLRYSRRAPADSIDTAPAAAPAAKPQTGSAERNRPLDATQPPAEVRPDTQAPPGGMVLPIQGLAAGQIQDTFYQSRGNGERIHEATDILSPRGTPVHAMVDGVVQKLFLSKPGGITVYEFDDNGEFCYYYAHLDRYADGLAEGQHVRAGDVIGYVGTTGNANPNTPHLHLAFFRLGPEKQWWKGTPINPYPTLMKLVGAQ